MHNLKWHGFFIVILLVWSNNTVWIFRQGQAASLCVRSCRCFFLITSPFIPRVSSVNSVFMDLVLKDWINRSIDHPWGCGFDDAFIQIIFVHHRRADIYMPRAFLNHANVKARCREVSGKRMPESMARGAFCWCISLMRVQDVMWLDFPFIPVSPTFWPLNYCTRLHE